MYTYMHCDRAASGAANRHTTSCVHVRQVDVGADDAAAINRELLTSYAAAPHEPITGLPLNLLNVNSAYTFQLRVETHVGAKSSLEEATVQVLADVPSVTINAPTSMLRSERLVLEPTVTVCGGAATGGLSWQWSASLGGTSARAGEEITLQDSSSRSLVVETNTLPSNETVVFSVSATATGGGTPGTSAALVVVKATPLVASISGGASASRGQEDDLSLDASSSYDPDAAITSTAALLYAWACTGSSYPNGSAAPGCIGRDGGVVVLQDASSSIAKVPKGTLRANHSYTFTVGVTTVDGRTAAAAISVQVEPSSPPLVSLVLGSVEGPQPLATKISADATLRVRSDAWAVGDRALSYAWSVVETSTSACSGTAAAARCTAAAAAAACACLLDASRGATCIWPLTRALDVKLAAASVDIMSPNLFLTSPGAFLSAGATYSFALGVTAEGGASCGFSTLSITLNAPPSGGSLTLLPANGTARNTSFALRAPGWVDDPEDLPLLYTYYYALAGTHGATVVGAGAGAGVPAAALPLGLSGFYAALDTTIPVAGPYEVFARVVDTQGCAALSMARNVNLTWGRPTQNSEDTTALAATIVADELEQAEVLGDTAKVQAVVSSAATLLDEALEQVAAGGAEEKEAVPNQKAKADAVDRRTELRATLIDGLKTSLTDGAASSFVNAHAQLVSKITSAPDELQPCSGLQGCDARLQAAQLAGSLARKIGQASGGDGGAQKSLATTLSNVLSGAQLNSDMPLPLSRRRGLAEASDGGNANATALVDSVDASLGALSASLVRGAVAGEGYTLDTPNLALRAARYTDLAALGNQNLTTNATNNIAAGGGSGGGGGSSVTLPALDNALGAALGAKNGTVDVQLVTYGLNPRAYAPGAELCAAGTSGNTNGCEEAAGGVANMTTLVLRQGEVALNVSNLSAPILLSFPVALLASLAVAAGSCSSMAAATCSDIDGGPKATKAAEAELEVQEARCKKVKEVADIGFKTAIRELARCDTILWALKTWLSVTATACCSALVTKLDAVLEVRAEVSALKKISADERDLVGRDDILSAINASLAAAAATCAAIEAPCSGHGACNDGSCACDDGWLGPECNAQFECRYYSEDQGAWATDGCEIVSEISPKDGAAGSVTCGCTHLTSFSTFAKTALLEGSSSTLSFDLSDLKLTTPFASWSELADVLRSLGAAGWSLVVAVYLAMLAALLAMHRRDERTLQAGFMPLWHKLLSPKTTTAARTRAATNWRAAAARASTTAVAAVVATAQGRERSRLLKEWPCLLPLAQVFWKASDRCLRLWHSRRGRKGRGYAHRLLSLVFLWFLLEHYLCAPFFLLPWDHRTRAQALCCAFAVLLGELNLLFLFWSSFKGMGDEWLDEPPSANHAFWSMLLHQLVAFCTLTVTTALFGLGLSKNKSLKPLRSGGKFFVREVTVAFTRQDVRRRVEVTVDEEGQVNGYEVMWVSERPSAGTARIVAVAAESIGARVRLEGGGTFENIGRRAEVESSEDMQSMVQHVLEQSTGWTLLYRQTAPLRWPRGIDVLHKWDPTSPNYAQLDSQTVDELRDEGGALTLRMQWFEAGDSKPTVTNIWRQISDPLQPGKVEGYEPLLIQEGAEKFGGLRGSKSKLNQLAQGAVSGRVALCVIGQHRMNKWGGLTSWEAGRKATQWRVELYALMPDSESARRLARSRPDGEAAAAQMPTSPQPPDSPGLSGLGKRLSVHVRSGARRLSSLRQAKPQDGDDGGGDAAAPEPSLLERALEKVEAKSSAEVEGEKQLRETLGLGDERKLIASQFRAHRAVFTLRQTIFQWYNTLFAEPDYVYETDETRAARRRTTSPATRRNTSPATRGKPSRAAPSVWTQCWACARGLGGGDGGEGGEEAGVGLASVEIQPSQLMFQEGPGNMGFFVQVGGECSSMHIRAHAHDMHMHMHVHMELQMCMCMDTRAFTCTYYTHLLKVDDCCRYVPVLRIFRHARRAPLSSLRGCMQRLAELAYRASYTRYHAEYAVDAQGQLPTSRRHHATAAATAAATADIASLGLPPTAPAPSPPPSPAEPRSPGRALHAMDIAVAIGASAAVGVASIAAKEVGRRVPRKAKRAVSKAQRERSKAKGVIPSGAAALPQGGDKQRVPSKAEIELRRWGEAVDARTMRPWRDAIQARSADRQLSGPISPSEIVEHPQMVHSQIAAFLYAAIAEEAISEEEARDELDAVCSGLPASYAWRVAGELWAPSYVQPIIWFVWGVNLLILLLLELLIATFILKLGANLEMGAFLETLFGYTLLDPVKDAACKQFSVVSWRSNLQPVTLWTVGGL